MIQEADTVRLISLDHSRGEQELLGERPSDLLRQAPGGVDPAILNGEESEPGALAAHADVQARREHRAASVSEAVQRADRRLAHGGEVP